MRELTVFNLNCLSHRLPVGVRGTWINYNKTGIITESDATGFCTILCSQNMSNIVSQWLALSPYVNVMGQFLCEFLSLSVWVPHAVRWHSLWNNWQLLMWTLWLFVPLSFSCDELATCPRCTPPKAPDRIQHPISDPDCRRSRDRKRFSGVDGIQFNSIQFDFICIVPYYQQMSTQVTLHDDQVKTTRATSCFTGSKHWGNSGSFITIKKIKKVAFKSGNIKLLLFSL